MSPLHASDPFPPSRTNPLALALFDVASRNLPAVDMVEGWSAETAGARCSPWPPGDPEMRKSTFITAIAVVGISLAGTAPSFAASAANSQNGTDSSNPNATLSPPTSTSAVPATNMPMGSTTGAAPMQDGSGMNGGAMGTGGAAGNGAGMKAEPKQ